MPIGIIYNPSAVSARNSLVSSSNDTKTAIQRLSSGERITKASDDVAGLAVGTQLESKVTILEAASNNIQQANALLSTADGALQNISDMLQRMNSLASQATSAALNDDSRFYLNQEFEGLRNEIDRLAVNTEFNGIKLIDGTFGVASTYATGTQIDAYATANSLSTAPLTVRNNTGALILDMTAGTSIDIADNAAGAAGTIDGFRIEFAATNSNVEVFIGDVRYAGVMSNTLANGASFTLTADDNSGFSVDITNNTGAALSNFASQVDANRLADAIEYAIKGQVSFQVGTVATDKIDVGLANNSSGSLGIAKDQIDNVSQAQTAVASVTKAINTLLSNRAAIGAYTSRFDKAFNAVGTSIQNQDSARGVFLDSDMASESTALAASQVKMNASISVLAQANSLNQSLLKLLG